MSLFNKTHTNAQICLICVLYYTSKMDLIAFLQVNLAMCFLTTHTRTHTHTHTHTHTYTLSCTLLFRKPKYGCRCLCITHNPGTHLKTAASGSNPASLYLMYTAVLREHSIRVVKWNLLIMSSDNCSIVLRKK